jgi:hypothetical protein
VVGAESTSSGKATGLDSECQRPVAQLTRFGADLAPADAEREYLRVHVQNLEAELRRVLHERGARIRELEAALAHAQAVHRLVVTSRSWRLTAPVRAVARAVRDVRSRTRRPGPAAEP